MLFQFIVFALRDL